MTAVVFDADGVLVSPDEADAFWQRGWGLTHAIRSGPYKARFVACLLGQADLVDVLPPILAAWGRSEPPESFLAAWLAAEASVDGRLVRTITALRRAGHPCWLASNQERHRAAYMRDVLGFGALFDGLVFSCDLGVKKPDPAFYGAAEAALGCTGGDILFFDDAEAHIAAARARGWRAEQYTTFGACAAALAGTGP